MSRGVSTARRYRADNGPVVFGIPGLDVRWNRESRCIVLTLDDDSGARWCETGEIAEMLLLALAKAHREQRLAEVLRLIFAEHRLGLRGVDAEYYRVGRLMCWRPSWQQAAAP